MAGLVRGGILGAEAQLTMLLGISATTCLAPQHELVTALRYLIVHRSMLLIRGLT